MADTQPDPLQESENVDSQGPHQETANVDSPETSEYTVLRTISDYAFDTARAYIHAQLRLQPVSRTDLEILRCLHTELLALHRVITENIDTEVIFLPEMTDHKYNHYEAIEYVLGRHYTSDSPPPEYFLRICEYVNASKGIPCSEKVLHLLGLLPLFSPTLEARFALILDKCNVQNWDGDDADPVPPEIVAFSKDVIQTLLIAGRPEPTIGATPCGGIDIVWEQPVSLYCTFRNPELSVLVSVITKNPDRYHAEDIAFAFDCPCPLARRISEILVNGPPPEQ